MMPKIKGKLMSIMFVVFLSVQIFSAVSQEAGLFLLTEFAYHPGKADDYGQVVQEFMKLYHTHKLPFTIMGHHMDDFHACYLIPLKNFADIGEFKLAKRTIIQKIGKGHWYELIKKEAEYTRYNSYSILRYCPEISLVPEEPKFTKETAHFVYWGYYHVIPGQEDAFKDSFKKIIDLYRQTDFKDVDYGWEFYQVVIGIDRPLYLFIHRGQNESDFWIQAEKRHRIAGEKLDIFFNQVLDKLRKFEVRTGWFLPEISHLADKSST